MKPQQPLATVNLDREAAFRGLSRRHSLAIEKPAVPHEPVIVVICHVLALLIGACGVIGGFALYGAAGLGPGLLAGVASSLGLWGLGTVVQLLWRIERRLGEKDGG